MVVGISEGTVLLSVCGRRISRQGMYFLSRASRGLIGTLKTLLDWFFESHMPETVGYMMRETSRL